MFSKKNKESLNLALDYSGKAWNKTTLDDGKTQVLIEVVEGVLIIAFQATKQPWDWIDNLFCNYKKRYENIHQEIMTYISDKKYNDIIICGHSRGGLLAFECLKVFWKDNLYFTPVNGFGFGIPKHLKYPQDYLPFISLVNGNDWVTKLPPWVKYSYNQKNIGESRKWWKFSWKDHKIDSYRKNLKRSGIL